MQKTKRIQFVIIDPNSFMLTGSNGLKKFLSFIKIETLGKLGIAEVKLIKNNLTHKKSFRKHTFNVLVS